MIKKVKFNEGTFIIDGNISQGNSGSPVLLKPSTSIKFGEGGKMVANRPRLIGIIYGHLKDVIDTTINQLSAKENAGLGLAISVDRIAELLSQKELQEPIE